MIDPDELMSDLKDEQEHIEALVHRTTEQAKDIKEMRQELEKLEEDIRASEEVEDTASGVAQS